MVGLILASELEEIELFLLIDLLIKMSLCDLESNENNSRNGSCWSEAKR